MVFFLFLIQIADFEDLQRQLCEQLQIIAELRQQTIVSERQHLLFNLYLDNNFTLFNKKQVLPFKFNDLYRRCSVCGLGHCI